MINTSGFLSVIDHGMTLHWEDGPTLHKMVAQVRYRMAEDAQSPLETLRVGTSQRCAEWDEEAEGVQCFVAANSAVSAQWLWREAGAGWAIKLNVRNIGEDTLFVDGLDLILIDAQRNGLFRLGTSPDLWQMHTAAGLLIVQPAKAATARDSNPPAVMFRAMTPQPVALQMKIIETQFIAFTASQEPKTHSLAANETLTTDELWVAAGNDIEELQQLAWPVSAEPALDHDFDDSDSDDSDNNDNHL